MVLQRDHPVAVWGKTQPSNGVTVAFGGQVKTTSSALNGKWKIIFDPMPASPEGRTLSVTTTGGGLQNLRDILVGDVWLCSGQSNMEFPVRSTTNGSREITQAIQPEIRLVKIPKRSSLAPLEDLAPQSRWTTCSPSAAAGFSAVGYFFGRELNRKLNVPVGLVQCAWSSTIIEAWAPASIPEQVTVLRHPIALRNRPGTLFNGMVSPLSSFGLKGVLWYQGESNASTKFGAAGGMEYKALLAGLIREWRKSFQADDLAFQIVQIANFGKQNDAGEESRRAEIREAEALCAGSISNCHLTATIDIGEARTIHPRNKQEVGRRLSLSALANVYGERIEWSGPQFRQMEIEGSRARILFDFTYSGLMFHGKRLNGFSIAGADNLFYQGEAQVDGSCVLVWSSSVAVPFAVRYAWADNPVCNLFNMSGLPVVPFRVVR